MLVAEVKETRESEQTLDLGVRVRFVDLILLFGSSCFVLVMELELESLAVKEEIEDEDDDRDKDEEMNMKKKSRFLIKNEEICNY